MSDELVKSTPKTPVKVLGGSDKWGVVEGAMYWNQDQTIFYRVEYADNIAAAVSVYIMVAREVIDLATGERGDFELMKIAELFRKWDACSHLRVGREGYVHDDYGPSHLLEGITTSYDVADRAMWTVNRVENPDRDWLPDCLDGPWLTGMDDHGVLRVPDNITLQFDDTTGYKDENNDPEHWVKARARKNEYLSRRTGKE